MKLRSIFNFLLYTFAIIGFILIAGYFGVKFGFTNTRGIIDTQREQFLKNGASSSWAAGEEWQTFKTAVIKDKQDIDRAAKLSHIESRLIVSPLVAEQLRLFYTEREVFKTVFAPLKILGNQSQFSWGIMGFKQETAKEIEDHLKDPASPYYLGKDYERLLDFKTDNPDKERFERITDEQSRFYSYLYTGLYLQQIMTQWKNSGFDISNKPEILNTLFNIGFEHSEPKADPQTGGSAIEIGGETRSFGRLAAEFYYSGELILEFSRE